MGHCNLYLGSASIGEVRWSIAGEQVQINAVCPFEEGYIYRPTLRGGDFSLPLGVMMPQDGSFQVTRTFPLEKCGPLVRGVEMRGEVYRSLPGEGKAGPLPFPFSRLTPVAGEKLSPDDVLLNRAVAQEPGTLYTHYSDRLYIAFPLREKQPSAFLPFFCIATAIHVPEGHYGVLCVDEKGFICAI